MSIIIKKLHGKLIMGKVFFGLFFYEELKGVKGVDLTPRETDVVSCVISNKSTKGIASTLMMSPRTVGTHIRNITLKLGCSSK